MNISSNYHNDKIAKPTQLTLHAALGCASGAAAGGNCASGAVSGVVGELAAETYADYALKQELANDGFITRADLNRIKQQGVQVASLAGGYSAILTSGLSGDNHSQIAENIYIGSRVGRNAGENNALLFIHGTKSSPKDADPEFIKALEDTFKEEVIQFDWAPGENNRQARIAAATELKTLLENYEFQEGESLNIITHSHGGNVFKEFSQIYKGDKKVDTSVFLGTPHRNDHVLNRNILSKNANLINVYDKGDWLIQDLIGGIDTPTPNFPYISFKDINPSKTIIGYQNIGSYQGGLIFIEKPTFGILRPEIKEVTFTNGFYDSHVYMDSKDVWNGFVKPNLKEND